MIILMDHTYSVKSALIASNEWTPKAYKQLDNIIIDFMVQQDIPGAALAVSLNNKLIYTQGYGVANTGQRVLSTSFFRLASISKPITAVAIMKLVENGQLQLDQKIFGRKGILTEYRPTGKGDKRILNITVRHLLQHSAGWDRDQVGDAVFWKLHKVTKEPNKDDAVIKFIMTKKLQFTPGKRHAYSNLGYLILGRVIETVTGIPYVNFVQEICGPVTILPGCAKQSDCHPLEVKYFNNRDNVLEPSVFPDEGLVQPQYGGLKMEGTESYGGWVMSAVDLLQLFNNIGRGSQTLVSEESFKLMIQKPSYELGQQWYGFGLDIQDNSLSWGHTGAMDGTSTTVQHHKSGLSWALLFNSWSKDMDMDGLIKYALSMISDLPLWTGSNIFNKNIVKSEKQIVYVLVPIKDIYDIMKTLEGYFISHINMIDYCGSLCVNVVWTKTLNKHLIFIDKNIKDIQHFIKTCNFCNTYVYLFESYYFRNDIYYIVGLRDNSVNVIQEIYVNLDVKEHLKQLEIMKKLRYTLKHQSVAVTVDSWSVSSVYDKEESNTVSWLQLTMENFVFELGKNSVKNLTPIYVNCFTVKDEPYVSAIWFPGQHKTYFQRHDVSIYGFLYELFETAKDNIYAEKMCGYYNEGVLNFLAVWSTDLSN